MAVNLLLLGTIGFGWFSAAKEQAVSGRSAIVAPPLPVEPPATWSTVQTDDLAEQRRQLEAEGFPPAAIRALITGRVKERFAERRKALEAARTKMPYWKNSAYDPALAAQSRALAREEQAAVRAVLGPDLDGPTATRLKRQLPGVSADAIDQLAALSERYADQRQAVYDLQRGIITPDDRERLNQLDREMHAEFARVLSPQELEEYDLRSSRVAESLRYSLGNFVLNESEFRAVYRLKADLAERLPATGSNTPAEVTLRNEAEKLTDSAIASALGPQRYEDYKKATDYGYRQTSVLVSRLGLPAEAADGLYGIKREIEQRRDIVYKSGAGREEMSRQLSTLQTEATARISGIFGGNTAMMEAYLQYGGSWWRYLGGTSPLGAKK